MTNFKRLTVKIRNQRGAVAMLTTLVLSSVLVMLAVSVVLTGISSRANAFVLKQSENVFVSLEGCIENALIRLNRDNGYLGHSFSVNDADCTVNVSGSGDERTVTVSGNRDEVTRDVSLQVQLTPNFGIIDWVD